jgi:translocation and assembly module TamB
VAPPVSASAVSVSADEVVVQETEAAGDEKSGQDTPDFIVEAVTGNVDIVLGDDVTIDAAGLTASLLGSVRWTKRRDELLGRGEGRLRIANGAYAAYGQRLSIKQGDLTFAGPVDNPAIDLKAVRPDLDVVAGISASGNIRSPALSLFSQPAMSDSDILSYLITGRALDDTSSGEAGLVARAALSLGAERSSAVTSRIQHAFGLDELSVSAGETASTSSLVAGKRITPKLSMRADFNPFDRLWTIFLNYKLTKTLSVEAESGQSQGADVIYSLERDRVMPDFKLLGR